MGKEPILPAAVTTQCRSLVPLGAGTVVGVKAHPLFTRPMAVWHHLKRLQKYNSEGWAQWQQSRVAQHRQKRRRAQGRTSNARSGGPQQRERCPGMGGAKRAARAYTGDFYAGPVPPEGTRRGSQYPVEQQRDDAAKGGGPVLLTPPQRCATARRPETRPRLPRLCLCVAHQHTQCSTCAAFGREVRHYCARRHAPPPPSPPPRD